MPMAPNGLFYAVGDFLNGNYNSFKNEYNNLIGSEEIDSNMYNEVHKMYELDNIRSAWLHDKDKYNEPIDMLLDAMNPDKNGFKIIKYNGDNRAFQENEIWTQDECLLVKYDKYLELVDSGIIP